MASHKATPPFLLKPQWNLMPCAETRQEATWGGTWRADRSDKTSDNVVVNLVILAIMSAVSDCAERRLERTSMINMIMTGSMNLMCVFFTFTLSVMARLRRRKRRKRGTEKRTWEEKRRQTIEVKMKGSLIWTLFIRREPLSSTLEPLSKRPSIKQRSRSVVWQPVIYQIPVSGEWACVSLSHVLLTLSEAGGAHNANRTSLSDWYIIHSDSQHLA